jgi:hypothetical protein
LCAQSAITIYPVRPFPAGILLASITTWTDFLSWTFKNRITHGNSRYLNSPTPTPESELTFYVRFCYFAGPNAVHVARPIDVFQHIEPN